MDVITIFLSLQNLWEIRNDDWFKNIHILLLNLTTLPFRGERGVSYFFAVIIQNQYFFKLRILIFECYQGKF